MQSKPGKNSASGEDLLNTSFGNCNPISGEESNKHSQKARAIDGLRKHPGRYRYCESDN